ncbi:hypothetical protein [Streptomyces sp. NPDC048551]|uniref:hypothetical protein n=1 Tax=Streptomyces sp. NPDC048551 TaxID=3155758 RepID=UPI0034163B5A
MEFEGLADEVAERLPAVRKRAGEAEVGLWSPGPALIPVIAARLLGATGPG